MTTAAALYKIFKDLSPQTQKEFIELVAPSKSSTLMNEIVDGVKEAKLIAKGKKKGYTLREILNGD